MNLTYKKYPSKYELQYVKWNGINFDRERLIKFVKRLKLTYFLSFIPYYRREHKMLKEILDTYDKDRIKGLLSGDQDVLRRCLIEKWARSCCIRSFLTFLSIFFHFPFPIISLKIFSNFFKSSPLAANRAPDFE